MAENRPHYRHELKFLINAGDRELLARRLDVLMRPGSPMRRRAAIKSAVSILTTTGTPLIARSSWA